MKQPTIVTSWWFQPLPPGHFRVGISRGLPHGLPGGYRRYARLAPGAWFRSELDPHAWSRRYFDEMLARLDPARVVRRAHGDDPWPGPGVAVLRAATPNPRWCHRGLVSAWLHDALGLEVFELGHEYRGCGWSHPKLPIEMRRERAP
jgi:hypothetical protein